MQRLYPHFKKITPNDFLLNMINHHLNQILMRHSKILTFEWILITSGVPTDSFVIPHLKYKMTSGS